MRVLLTTICPRCGFESSIYGLNIEAATEIAALHVCADGVRTPSGPLQERAVPGPGEHRRREVEILL